MKKSELIKEIKEELTNILKEQDLSRYKASYRVRGLRHLKTMLSMANRHLNLKHGTWNPETQGLIDELRDNLKKKIKEYENSLKVHGKQGAQ